MKRIGRCFAIALVLCAVFCNCVSSNEYVPTVRGTPGFLGGITPGDTMYTVRKLYGAPESSRYYPMYHNKRELHVYENPQLLIAVSEEGKVRWLYTETPDCATEHGIRVGSTLNELVAAYGQPDTRELVYSSAEEAKRYGCKIDDYVFYCYHNNGFLNYGFLFLIMRGSVASIEIGWLTDAKGEPGV